MGAGLGGFWADGSTRSAIEDFVARVTSAGGPDFVEPADRVAVFDNDGTLWCEKPMPIQLDFTIRRFAEMAAKNPGLQQTQRGRRPMSTTFSGSVRRWSSTIRATTAT